MRTKLLQDAIAIAVQAWPLPAFSDEAATCTWVGKLATGLAHVGYDCVLSDTPAGAFAAERPYSAEEVEAAYRAVVSAPGFAAAPLNKIGDGSILKFLQSVNWSQLIATIVQIIAIIPKTPAPA